MGVEQKKCRRKVEGGDVSVWGGGGGGDEQITDEGIHQNIKMHPFIRRVLEPKSTKLLLPKHLISPNSIPVPQYQGPYCPYCLQF